MSKHFTDADREAICGYLHSIPAVKNMVPEPIIAGAESMAEMQPSMQ